MMSKRLLLAACLVVLAIAGGIGFFSFNNTANASLAMTELDVKKMTCGSCVATITEALQQVDGVQTVEVSVTTGRSQVTFDPARISAASIADVVTGSGYPATVATQLTTEQYQILQAETDRLAEIYVAKIGQRFLARDEFDQLIEQRMAAAGFLNRPEIRPQFIAQVWPGLKQRILLLEAAAKNNVVVQDGEVALRIQKMKQQNPNLDSISLARYGSLDNFQRQIKEDMIINRNIEDYVLAEVKEPGQRQEHFNQWFQGLMGNAPVVIYDAQLKQATSSAGGGCGSGGGGCCSKS